MSMALLSAPSHAALSNLKHLLRAPRAFFWLQTGCIAVLVAVALSGCSGESATARERAEKRLADGDLAGAVIELKAALQDSPADGELRFVLGQVYNDVLDSEAAESELRKALEAGADKNGEVLFELALSLLRQTEFAQVITNIGNDLSGFEPAMQANLNALKGHAHFGLGEVRDARKYLKLAKELAAAEPYVMLLESQLQIEARDIDGALKTADAIVEQHPAFFEAWLVKAEILNAKDDVDGALGAYAKIVELKPTSFPGRYRRVALFLSLGRFKEAEDDLKVLSSNYPRSAKVGARKGMLRLLEGKPEDALAAARNALSLDPNSMDAQLVAGASQRLLGNSNQAITTLARVVGQRPRNALANRFFADAFLAQNQAKEALQVVKNYYERGGRNTDVLVLGGAANLRLGDVAAAEIWYERASEAESERFDVKFSQAYARLLAGDLEAGIDDFEKLVSTPEAPPSYADELLVTTLLRRGERERAQAIVEKLLARSPDESIPHNLKGIFALSGGELDDARAAFESALAINKDFFPAIQNLSQLDEVAGELDKARGRISEFLQGRPKHEPGLRLLAEFDLRNRNFAEAAKTYEFLVSQRPEDQAAWERLTATYRALGNTSAGAQAAERGMKANAEVPEMVILAANATLADGRPAEAIRIIERLLEILAQSEDAYVTVASFQAKAEQYREAERTLQIVNNRSRFSVKGHVVLAQILLAQNKVDEAFRLADQMEQRAPPLPLGKVIRAEILERVGRFEEAAEQYQAVLDANPSGSMAVKRYQALSRAGKAKDALDWLTSWVQANPEDRVGRAGLGDALMLAEDPQGALVHYEAAIEAGGTNIQLLNNLAWAYQGLGDERALSTATRAHRAAPDSPTTNYTLGFMYLEAKRADEAIQFLQRAVVLAPRGAQPRLALARALHAAGLAEKARKQAKLALKADDADQFSAKVNDFLSTLPSQ